LTGFVKETKYSYCAVQKESLNIIQINLVPEENAVNSV